MRPKTVRKPFSLYKKPSGAGPAVWYVRFWDPEARRYAATRSTGVLAEGKRERRAEAEAAARAMLPEVRFTPSAADTPFLDFVADFWTLGSPYVRDRALVGGKALSRCYVETNHEDVRRHLRPFPPFRSLTLGDLSPGLIRDWMTWARGRGLSPRRLNAVLQAARVAVRWAVNREELPRDPFARIGEAREETREKGILSASEVAALIAAPVEDPRGRLGVLLAVLCGMRRGEVRGLLWGDIDLGRGLIHVRHNLVPGEAKLKAPKAGSARAVPLPAAVRAALEAVRPLSCHKDPEAPILGKVGTPRRPICASFLSDQLVLILEAIGIPRDAQRERNLTLHSLRHSFVTLGRMAGLPDIAIQALAGHKGAAMMQRYSHAGQVIDFDEARKSMEAAIQSGAHNTKAKKAAGG